jgi:hypothetical protein
VLPGGDVRVKAVSGPLSVDGVVCSSGRSGCCCERHARQPHGSGATDSDFDGRNSGFKTFEVYQLS